MLGMKLIIVILLVGMFVVKLLWGIEKYKYFFSEPRKQKERCYIISSFTMLILLIIVAMAEIVIESKSYEVTVMTKKLNWSEKEQIYSILEQSDSEIEIIPTAEGDEPKMFEYTTYRTNPISDRWDCYLFQSRLAAVQTRYRLYIPEGELVNPTSQ